MLSWFVFHFFTLVYFHSEATLTINVQNINRQTGQIRVALYAPCDGFPSNCQPVAGQVIDPTGNSVRVTFAVKPGDYAVALYQDLNRNGKLDTKLFGIPSEPYGFSNNFRPKLSGPNFDDCRVRIDEAGKTISIKLI
ncbi:DUF2141 domain-containing protein [Larkinella bovis]|uniref:DUF2141 domain-containing protein n=1 Tax=Larkinella bovis TaxID=683041 RepID=A0ABW0IGX4_9BACT